jgi:hypothetical protein
MLASSLNIDALQALITETSAKLGAAKARYVEFGTRVEGYVKEQRATIKRVHDNEITVAELQGKLIAVDAAIRALNIERSHCEASIKTHMANIGSLERMKKSVLEHMVAYADMIAAEQAAKVAREKYQALAPIEKFNLANPMEVIVHTSSSIYCASPTCSNLGCTAHPRA